MLRPSRADLAASCRACFLFMQCFTAVNVCPFTKTCIPMLPCTPGASSYLGRVNRFFWQYWFKMLTKSTKWSGEEMEKNKLQLSDFNYVRIAFTISSDITRNVRSWKAETFVEYTQINLFVFSFSLLCSVLENHGFFVQYHFFSVV